MGMLKIRCIYEKNGCEEILFLNNLTNHERSCPFERNLCRICACERSLEHDCV
jgi:hypothetical protein